MLNSLPKKKTDKASPRQTHLPWDAWEAPTEEIRKIVKKFVLANALNPEIAGIQFDNGAYSGSHSDKVQDQLPKSMSFQVPLSRGVPHAFRNRYSRQKKLTVPDNESLKPLFFRCPWSWNKTLRTAELLMPYTL